LSSIIWIHTSSVVSSNVPWCVSPPATLITTSTSCHLVSCDLIKVRYRHVRAFLGQPGCTGPADTVPAAGDDHRSACEASKPLLLHEWSLPLSSSSAYQFDLVSMGESTHWQAPEVGALPDEAVPSDCLA
jgi:hypothetical protein